ncbi:MAG: hypothetical protein Q9170_006998 [Blastenia crenularia]
MPMPVPPQSVPSVPTIRLIPSSAPALTVTENGKITFDQCKGKENKVHSDYGSTSNSGGSWEKLEDWAQDWFTAYKELSFLADFRVEEPSPETHKQPAPAFRMELNQVLPEAKGPAMEFRHFRPDPGRLYAIISILAPQIKASSKVRPHD